MEIIKQFVVKQRNNLVNIVELQNMGQFREEKISAFSARLNGKANHCDLVVECTGCQTEVSFKEKLIKYQLVRGLADSDIPTRVFQASAQVEGGKCPLPVPSNWLRL